MPSSRFCGSLSTVKVSISSSRSLRELATRSACHHSLCHYRREWSFSSKQMEVNAGSSHSNEKQPMDCSTSSNEVNMPIEKKVTASVFVNHAEIAWHESRRKWIGDQSQRPQKKAKDPIISWSTPYEELLSNNQPFPEPIPLSEMVDFLVDIWLDQGLFD